MSCEYTSVSINFLQVRSSIEFVCECAANGSGLCVGLQAQVEVVDEAGVDRAWNDTCNDCQANDEEDEVEQESIEEETVAVDEPEIEAQTPPENASESHDDISDDEFESLLSALGSSDGVGKETEANGSEPDSDDITEDDLSTKEKLAIKVKI